MPNGKSGLACHRMFDHPHHFMPDVYPMFGGMWGVRGGVLIGIQAAIERWGVWNKKPDDMYFLRERIWPIVRGSTLTHGGPTGLPFPPHAPYQGFVGQQLFDMPWMV